MSPDFFVTYLPDRSWLFDKTARDKFVKYTGNESLIRDPLLKGTRLDIHQVRG